MWGQNSTLLPSTRTGSAYTKPASNYGWRLGQISREIKTNSNLPESPGPLGFLSTSMYTTYWSSYIQVTSPCWGTTIQTPRGFPSWQFKAVVRGHNENTRFSLPSHTPSVWRPPRDAKCDERRTRSGKVLYSRLQLGTEKRWLLPLGTTPRGVGLSLHGSSARKLSGRQTKRGLPPTAVNKLTQH